MDPFKINLWKLEDSYYVEVRPEDDDLPIMSYRSPAAPATRSANSTGNQRRGACTHMRVERLYGPFKCPHCHLYPDLGWLWRCIDDFTPPQLATDEFPLSDPEVEAHYTAGQIETLKAQKQAVADGIAHLDKSIDDVISAMLPPAGQASPTVDATSATHLALAGTATQMAPGNVANLPSGLDAFTKCRWTCCHNCRPACIERSWLYLGDPSPADLRLHHPGNRNNNPPVSDVNIVRNLGLGNQPSESHDHENWTSSSSDYGIPEDENVKKGFRASIRKAFREMLSGRRQPASLPSDSAGSTHYNLPILEEAVEEYDEQVWREYNEEMLYFAASVELPDEHGDDGLGFGSGEVEVGVALTEEAVEGGTADIMTQV